MKIKEFIEKLQEIYNEEGKQTEIIFNVINVVWDMSLKNAEIHNIQDLYIRNNILKNNNKNEKDLVIILDNK